MAGHSKWSNTKHRKSAQDNKKGKIFTKIIREIITATKIGKSNDPNKNSKLRTAIEKALSNNMTRDTINKAISGCQKNSNITCTYEGYGPGGTAIIIICMTNNRNRTVSTLRHAFQKVGGNLSGDGSVLYLFQKKGILSFSSLLDENYVINKVLDLGLNIEDLISKKDGSLEIVTAWECVHIVRKKLELSGLKSEFAKISMIPVTKINLTEETYIKLKNFITLLKNCEDIKKIYHNADIIKSL